MYVSAHTSVESVLDSIPVPLGGHVIRQASVCVSAHTSVESVLDSNPVPLGGHAIRQASVCLSTYICRHTISGCSCLNLQKSSLNS